MSLVATGPFELRTWHEVQSGNSSNLNAASTKMAMVIRCGKTGTITKVHFFADSVFTAGSVRVSLQDLDANGNPDGTLDQQATVTVSAIGWVTSTLDAGRAVTRGDSFAVVLDFATYTTQSFSIAKGTSSRLLTVHVRDFTGGPSWNPTGYPVVALEYSDGTFGWQPGTEPGRLTSTIFGVDTNPDEVALRFKIPVPVKITGMSFMATLATNETYTAELQDSAGATLSGPHAISTSHITSFAPLMILFPTEISLTKDTVYRLAVKPTTPAGIPSAITVYHIDALSVAAMAQRDSGAEWYWSQRFNGGVWVDTTTKVPLIRPILSALDDGVSASTNKRRPRIMVGG